MVDYNAEEKAILRLARAFREMEATEWWKEYEKIVRAQIDTRETLLRLPLSETNEAFKGMDFMTRAASQETIKGAVIGLRLALSIPSLTIKHGSDILRDHGGVNEDA